MLGKNPIDGFTVRPEEVQFWGSDLQRPECVLAEADGSLWAADLRGFVHIMPNGAQRLVTQMYFEGDPLIATCPIVQTIPDAGAVDRLIARLDLNASIPLDTMAYRFDIVLRGRRSTLFENRLAGN